jgi:hypothetical protein
VLAAIIWHYLADASLDRVDLSDLPAPMNFGIGSMRRSCWRRGAHPHTMSGSMPASASASMTPMCDQPRAAPLPSARPMRGLAIDLHLGATTDVKGGN